MTDKPWGGRFTEELDQVAARMNASVDVDARLGPEDVRGSIAHVRMLAARGIVGAEDAAKIEAGLARIGGEIERGEMGWRADREDVHMNVEALLTERIGEAGGRLHTGRSRNDQVATDMRLWTRSACERVMTKLDRLVAVLAVRAEGEIDVLVPGYTHLQRAQPVRLSHHLLAWCEMLERDRERFADAHKRMNESPLGAAALAGTSFPIDRHMTAQTLGFDRPTANSLDSVSDRDFVLETLSAAAICATHLSRFAEEIVLWTTPQFAFISLSDKFTTGSSIMPQKRNPDAAELVRGKSGRIIGALTALLIVMKGLPLAYSKDMQEDKEGAFDSLDNLALCIAAIAGMARDMRVNRDRMKSAAGAGYATATDLADWLVRRLNMPFREAHHVTGRVVALAESRGAGLEDLSLADLHSVEPRITEEVFGVLGVENSVASRTSYGGAAPENVRKAAQSWLDCLKAQG